MPTNVFKQGAWTGAAEVKPRTLCSVYACVDDARRMLYVHRCENFPSSEYSESLWRCIAIGAEPPSGLGAKLRLRGYVEVVDE